MDFKNIHIGKVIEEKVAERGIDVSRICSFLKTDEREVEAMFQAHSINTYLLLRWSKLLEYDFFRLYTQHLILYSPQSGIQRSPESKTVTGLPVFRKNIYTREIIEFILHLIYSGIKTKQEIIEQYRIPKTTLYKWISKNEKDSLQPAEARRPS